MLRHHESDLDWSFLRCMSKKMSLWWPFVFMADMEYLMLADVFFTELLLLWAMCSFPPKSLHPMIWPWFS